MNKTNAKLYKANLQKKNRATLQVNSMMHKRHNILAWKKLNGGVNIPKKQKKLEDKHNARRLKHGKTKTAKVYRKLMHLGPDLLGCLSKKSAPAVPTPQPARKTRKMSANTQRIKKKIVKQCRI